MERRRKGGGQYDYHKMRPLFYKPLLSLPFSSKSCSRPKMGPSKKGVLREKKEFFKIGAKKILPRSQKKCFFPPSRKRFISRLEMLLFLNWKNSASSIDFFPLSFRFHFLLFFFLLLLSLFFPWELSAPHFSLRSSSLLSLPLSFLPPPMLPIPCFPLPTLKRNSAADEK